MNTHSMSKGFVIAVGLLALALMIPIMIQEASMIANWTHSGFVLCSVQSLPDTSVRFFEVDPADFVQSPRPVSRDTILTLNDTTANEKRWIALLETPHEPGREVALTFRHNGLEQRTTIRTRPVQAELRWTVAILQTLKVLIFLSLVVVGFWAFSRRPDSTGVRTLALFCFSLALLVMLWRLPMYPAMASLHIPFEGLVRRVISIVGLLTGSFWLLLNFLFPRPARLMLQHPWLAYALAFAPQVILFAAGIVLQVWWPGRFPFLRLLWIPAFIAQVIAGSVLLWFHHRRAETMLERRQTKLVLYGSAVGLVLLVFLLIRPFGWTLPIVNVPVIDRLLLQNAVFAVTLLSPISIAYALGKYRLLEVEGRLRRGTRYLLVTGFLLVVFFALVYFAGGLLLTHLNITSRAPTLFLALVLALGFAPASRIIHTQMERYFFPERQRLRAMAQDFVPDAFTQPNREVFRHALEDRLRENLGVREAHLWMCDDYDGTNGHFTHESEVVQLMEQENHPLFVDEALAARHVNLAAVEREWIEQHEVALIVPLKAHERLEGFLALGHKPAAEDYQPEEVRILDSLAGQLALAVENLRLIEENVGKHRLEEQLQLARRVQHGFLPHEIPAVPGLQLAARSAFCLEVAGDYYDIIALGDGRTVLAIGDVSGKGAGAAMIMANLQAALRTLCTVDLSLTEVMTRINTLIFQNTDPDQFVTLFVGRFDPRDRHLQYVNAGHNPPWLIRHGGMADMLSDGGMIIGAFEDAHYVEGEVFLLPGDLLVLYTDGISEAMNAAGEELGEGRICETARDGMGKSATDILRSLEALVTKHQSKPQMDDDQTLVVAKVV